MDVLLLQLLIHFDRVILAEQHSFLGRVVFEHLLVVAGELETCRRRQAARALQKLIGAIVVQPHDGVVRQEGELLAVGVVAHVAPVLEVVLQVDDVLVGVGVV